MIQEDPSELEAVAQAASEDEGGCFFYTREAVNPYGANTLVQCPLRFHATPTRGDTDEDFCALFDTGGSDTFISTQRVEEFGFPIEPHQAVVKNGDGSKQISPGYVWATISIGSAFKVRYRFRVVKLDRFDVIIGINMIRHYKIEMRHEPFRLTAVRPSQVQGKRTVTSTRVNLPTCALARRDTSGRDVSAYICDKEELIHCCKVYAAQEGRIGSLDDALVVVPDQADGISYSLMVKELCDYANTCTAAEFSAHCNALLSDLAGIGNDDEARAEGVSAGSADDAQHDLTKNDAPKSSVFSAPSAHRYSAVEQAFRERVVREFADLCSDTLPREGPSATLPDGTPYKVKLNLKPGAVPQGRRPFRVPEAYRAELQKTIDDLLAYKLIEPTISPYSNPVFLVPKPPRPNGESAGLRFVWDGRSVNKALESDAFMIPRVEDLIDRIAQLKWEAEKAGFTEMFFSGIDQRTSFWQCALDEDSRPLTAFSTPTAQYQWTCLPMGMLTSSAHLQRFTEAMLRPFTQSNTFEYTNAAGKLIKAYGTAVGYIDDIGVVSFGTVEDHEYLLLQVLRAMSKCRLRIQPAKCEFFRESGSFLGHVLSAEGIAQQDGKVQAIKNWPSLTDLKSVRAFVSLCSYYRKFVKDFARIAAPLTDLLKKDMFKTPLPDEALAAFDKLKEALMSAPVLAYFDVTKCHELYVDACGVSIGAVLQQHDEKDPDDGSHPVGFYSRRLNPAEQNYATYDKELLGLRDGVLHFRHQLLGIPFKVHTDHCSLRWLFNQPEISGQRQRWLAVLSQFQLTEIVHIPGVQNVVADVLSRYADPTGPSYEHLLPHDGNMDVHFSTHLQAEECRAMSEVLFSLDQIRRSEINFNKQESPTLLPLPTQLFPEHEQGDRNPCSVDANQDVRRCMECKSTTCDTLQAEFARHAIEPITPHGMKKDSALEEGFAGVSIVSATADIKAFVDGYSSCEDFRVIYSALQELQDGEVHDVYPEYSIRAPSNLLIFRDGGVDRVCVPTSRRNLLLKVMHDLPLGMHQAAKKMFALMSARFYFPGMCDRVKKYVETCEHCQRNKAYTRSTRGVPTPHKIPLRRFDVVALDIVSGFPASKSGKDAIVVFTDRLTKRAWIEPCTKTSSARDLALIFFRTVFRDQGMPRILLSDNGPQFTSDFWKAFYELLQTDIRLTSSYHPQSNGGSERFNRTLIEALRSYVNARHDDWDEYLVHIEFAYNSSVNPATGFSPFLLQFAQSPRAPWDAVLEGGNVSEAEFETGNDLALRLGFDIIQNLKSARDTLHAAAQQHRLRNALAHAPHAYSVGDLVLLSTEHVDLKQASRKFGPKFVGPFRVEALLGRNAVKLTLTGRFKCLNRNINVEYLRPYRERSENVGPPPAHLAVKPLAVDPRGEWYQIADILHHRGKPGPKQQCLVRWEGFDASHDSWIPRNAITDKALVAYETFLREMADYRAAHKQSLESFVGPNQEFSVIKKQQVFDVPAPPKPVKSDANRAAAALGDASVAASGVEARLRRAPNVTIPSGNLRRSARLRATT